MGDKMLENEDSLAILRNKVKDEVMKSDFRRKLIGGISEEDVEDYINSIRMQSEYRENKLNEKIEELISFSDKLKIEYNTYVKKAEEEKKKLLKELEETKQNLQSYIDHSKTTDESEEKYKTELERLNVEVNMVSVERDSLKNQLNNVYKEIESSKANSSNIESERTRYETQIDELKRELSDIRKRFDEKSSAYIELHSKSKNFNEELNSMYKELAGVKEQVKMNYELQRQLEQERMKTETVEKEMTDFFKRIIELNNKNSEA